MSIVAVHAAAGQVTFSGRRPTVPKGTAASPDSGTSEVAEPSMVPSGRQRRTGPRDRSPKWAERREAQSPLQSPSCSSRDGFGCSSLTIGLQVTCSTHLNAGFELLAKRFRHSARQSRGAVTRAAEELGSKGCEVQ
jgi:hypothetical protein